MKTLTVITTSAAFTAFVVLPYVPEVTAVAVSLGAFLGITLLDYRGPSFCNYRRTSRRVEPSAAVEMAVPTHIERLGLAT